MTVSFDGRSSTDPDGDPLTLSWDFGDATGGSSLTPTHTHSAVGDYTVTLTATDSTGLTDTATTIISVVPVPPPGLDGTYFDNADLTNPKLVRNDSTINFDWGSGSPDPGLAPDRFSVRWLGRIEPLYSETYTFYALSDDGFRLWRGYLERRGCLSFRVSDLERKHRHCQPDGWDTEHGSVG